MHRWVEEWVKAALWLGSAALWGGYPAVSIGCGFMAGVYFCDGLHLFLAWKWPLGGERCK